MYKNFTYSDITKNQADKIINYDRQKHAFIYEALLKFLRTYEHKDSLLISGTLAYNGIIDNKIEPDQIMYDAYPCIIHTDEPFRTASDLLKYIAEWKDPDKHHIKQLLACMPVITNFEYEIKSTNRKYAIVKFLGQYRTTNMIKLIRPVELSGIRLMPPELLLIDIYRNIFTADSTDQQTTLIDLEAKLYKKFIKDYENNKLDVEGAREDNSKLISIIRHIAYELFVPDSRVAINSKAANSKSFLVGTLLNQKITPSSDLAGLEFVTELSDEEIHSNITKINELLNNRHADIIMQYNGKCKIMPYRYHLNLPNDVRLMRYRFNLETEHSKTLLFDIFNAGQYDLIADHSIIYMRMLLVNVWTIRLISAIGDMAQEPAQKLIDKFIHKIIAIRPKVLQLDLNRTKIQGIYIDELYAKRMMIKYKKKDHSEIIYAAYSFPSS